MKSDREYEELARDTAFLFYYYFLTTLVQRCTLLRLVWGLAKSYGPFLRRHCRLVKYATRKIARRLRVRRALTRHHFDFHHISAVQYLKIGQHFNIFVPSADELCTARLDG